MAQSSHATQQVTLNCQGIINFLNTNNRSYYAYPAIWTSLDGDAWTVPTADELVEARRIYRPRLIQDGCYQNSGSVISKTVSLLEGPAASLPVADLYLYDFGGAGEMFGLELGDVYVSGAYKAPSNGMLGTRFNPAKTCYDLYLSATYAADGEYFIDPNGGSHRDAIKVFCNITGGGWTGIYPSEQVPLAHYLGASGDAYTWYSSTSAGSQLQYSISGSQLTALLDLSFEGWQTIAWQCKGVVVIGSNVDVRFKASQGYVWTIDDYTVRNDECHVNNNNQLLSGVADLVGEPSNLPIIDFELRDWGDAPEEIGMYFTAAWVR